MTIRAAVIGASFARDAYLPALRTLPDVELVAISSARLESAQAVANAFNIPHAYDDWSAMLDAHELDLVGIATPTIYHAPMALKALQRGAHVICEKPMAMNVQEAREMYETAESLGRLHIIGHELRFNPTRRKLKALIDERAIGDVRHVQIVNISPTWGDPASRPMGDWWSDASMGGGRLGANGSHQIDLIRWWLGEVARVRGEVRTLVPNRIDKSSGAAWTATADDFTQFQLEMQSGAVVSVLLSGIARHNMGNTSQIFGSEGTITLDNADEVLRVAAAGQSWEEHRINDPNATLDGINKGIWNVSFVGLMHEFTAAIREGRKLNAGATFYDGWRTQQVMDAVIASSAEGGWVTVG